MKEIRKELPVIVSAGNSNNSSFKEKTKLTKSKSIDFSCVLDFNFNLFLGADTLDTGSKSLQPEIICQRSCSIDSLRTTGHSRSVSHDSYFDLLQSPLRGGMTTCPSRELSELGLNFDREEPEMRIFSESESLVSSPKVGKDAVPRRVHRARPEEYSSIANSVNPSPKKQPRLNLSSPSELKTWATIINEVANEGVKDEESSSCKRYKLEDQLSDIQFIDCNTPEHSVTTSLAANVNTGYTIYTQIQIHNPPSLYERPEQHKTIIDTTTMPLRQENERYSYPVTQYTTFAATKKDERYSYPIAITTSQKEDDNVYQMNISDSPPITTKKANTIEASSVQNQLIMQDVTRSCSEVFNKSELTKSKLSAATPQSPMKSPSYSLLIGSTASSASPSPVNTPIYDMDICNHYEPINFTSKQEVVVMQVNEGKKKLKNELSLDLNKANRINVKSSPSTPQILTASDKTEAGNTSQSVTPSEIGYQNLFSRQASVTPEIDESSGFIKPTIVHVSAPTKPIVADKSSPIKSTISITYNLKSPTSSKSYSGQHQFFNEDFQKEDLDNKDGLLETSFDAKMVYEQVKFFKTAIDQVNDMVDEKSSLKSKDQADAEEQYDIVFKNDVKLMLTDVHMKDEGPQDNDKPDCDQELENQDSLEFDQNLSLYENVDVKRPAKIYENVQLPSLLNSSPVRQPKVSFDKNHAIDDLHREIETQKVNEKSPTNVSNVRKLATKFETSPVDGHPPFDFSKSPSHRKPEVQMRKNSNRNAELYAITRSLDENAFIREFGSAKKFEEFNKSINEIADLTGLGNVLNRRKSIDYSKPKSLNQPKKLPGFNSHIPDKHENCRRSVGDADGGGHKLKLNIGDGDYVDSQRSPSIGSDRMPLQSFNVRITPTTENRISLIQSNFEDKKTSSDDEKSTSTTSLTSLKKLNLDRERIEKIKEERRHQLNEKYRSESFRNLNNNIKLTKPKSKQEINIDDFSDDVSINSQRFKSKSRNELDLEQPYSLITTTSSSTNNLTSNNRVRRISDEKNQNDLDSGSDDQVVIRSKDAETSDLRDTKFENKTRPKFDKRSFELNRERNNSSGSLRYSQSSSQ